MTHESASPVLVPPHAPGGNFEDNAHWGYTQSAREIAALRQHAERQAGRAERHTIGRDTSLMEGVYEGAYGGEAIVIDYDKDPALIDKAVNSVLAQARDSQTGRVDKKKILQGVFDTVSQTMHYDSEAVDDIFRKELNGRDGAKISLSYYIASGVGECRHQALFAGTVLERLRQLGIVQGRASVDRNMVKKGPDGKYDGHAWVRYTNSAGEVIILDVAQKKMDSLEDLMAAHAKDPSHTWDYARPEDKQRAAGHIAAKVVEARGTEDEPGRTNAKGIIDHVPWEVGRQGDESEARGKEVAGANDAVQENAVELRSRLVANLSPNDRTHLAAYAAALESKREAQKAGAGDDSTYWGQVAGQYYRNLSAEARAVASSYLALYGK